MQSKIASRPVSPLLSGKSCDSDLLDKLEEEARRIAQEEEEDSAGDYQSSDTAAKKFLKAKEAEETAVYEKGKTFCAEKTASTTDRNLRDLCDRVEVCVKRRPLCQFRK